jgi:hypothetical protein
MLFPIEGINIDVSDNPNNVNSTFKFKRFEHCPASSSEVSGKDGDDKTYNL